MVCARRRRHAQQSRRHSPFAELTCAIQIRTEHRGGPMRGQQLALARPKPFWCCRSDLQDHLGIVSAFRRNARGQYNTVNVHSDGGWTRVPRAVAPVNTAGEKIQGKLERSLDMCVVWPSSLPLWRGGTHSRYFLAPVVAPAAVVAPVITKPPPILFGFVKKIQGPDFWETSW